MSFFGKIKSEALKFIDDKDDLVSQSGDFDDGASVDSESLDIQTRYERAQAKIAKYQKKFGGQYPGFFPHFPIFTTII